MNKVRIFLMALILLGTGAPARAGIDEGRAAYQRGDYKTAVEEWRPLAEQRDADVQAMLGAMYDEGWGVRQDYATAAKWYRKAAEQGHVYAQNNLGVMYHNGEGVPQDFSEALRWYRKSAEQGYAVAQGNLGAMYGKGEGVPQDYVLAHMWSNLAASRLPPGQDRDKAVRNRDFIAQQMSRGQIAEAQRLAREWVEEYEAN